MQKPLIFSLILLCVSALFTLALLFADRTSVVAGELSASFDCYSADNAPAPIQCPGLGRGTLPHAACGPCPEGAQCLCAEETPDYTLGFSSLNLAVYRTLGGFNQNFYRISEILGYLVFVIVGAYVLLGLVTLVKQKSLKKLPHAFYCLAGLYFITLVIYLVFDHLPINFRPIFLDGALELSYPSSHTLFAVTFLVSATLANPLVFPKSLHKIITPLNIALYLIATLTVLTRLLSGVHWFTDIFGGLLISATLLSFFSFALAASRSLKTSRPVKAST